MKLPQRCAVDINKTSWTHCGTLLRKPSNTSDSSPAYLGLWLSFDKRKLLVRHPAYLQVFTTLKDQLVWYVPFGLEEDDSYDLPAQFVPLAESAKATRYRLRHILEVAFGRNSGTLLDHRYALTPELQDILLLR